MTHDETFVTQFDAGANSDGVATVFESVQGPPVRIESVTLYREGSAVGPVTVGVYAGERRLAPSNEDLAVFDEPVTIDTSAEIGPDSTLEARWENTSGTARGVSVVVYANRLDD
jgi:hypothetical protein